MKVNVYVRPKRLQLSVDVNLSTEGESRTFNLNAGLGSVTVKLSKRTTYNYHREEWETFITNKMSEVGWENEYEITYTGTGVYHGDGYELGYTQEDTTTYPDQRSETHQYPYAREFTGAPSHAKFTCDGQITREYSELGSWVLAYTQDVEYIDGHIDIYLTKTSYQLRFDGNGGTGAPGPLSFTTYDMIDLPKVFPSRKGYSFKGWDAAPGSVNPTYVYNKTTDAWNARVYAGTPGDMRLYAIWQAIDYTYLPMRHLTSGVLLRNQQRNHLIIRHGDAQ